MIKWGVMGPGRIAHNIAKGIAVTDGAVIQAVASRNGQRAKQFANEYQVEAVYSDYQALNVRLESLLDARQQLNNYNPIVGLNSK
ncbi:Gfo/Idh/MocA family oxidoreductase [Vibrio sp. 10N]|uniref:Gfo/Idh/MocA family oxidoreductase n=1 Tax=Vibrio sp. 10N TaxID=3058938 RepID=UPI0028135FAE|nr:hypothetical protein VB10N_39170 [Vibrio sp. 10N]